MSMKHYTGLLLAALCCSQALHATDLTQSTIVYNPKDHPLAQQMAQVLSEDCLFLPLILQKVRTLSLFVSV